MNRSVKRLPLICFLIAGFILTSCTAITPVKPTVDAAGTFTAVARTFVIPPASPSQTPFQPINSTNTPIPSATPSQITTPSITPLFPGYITWTPSKCDYSAFIQDVTIPDGTFLAPGAAFTKIWRISNIGSCTWTSQYRFQYISGDPMGADTIYLPQTVSPGQTFDLSLNMVAPDVDEDYSNFWRLRNPAGEIFGTTFSTVITVSSSTNNSGDATATTESGNTEDPGDIFASTPTP
jgi:hypothetical protein